MLASLLTYTRFLQTSEYSRYIVVWMCSIVLSGALVLIFHWLLPANNLYPPSPLLPITLSSSHPSSLSIVLFTPLSPTSPPPISSINIHATLLSALCSQRCTIHHKFLPYITHNLTYLNTRLRRLIIITHTQQRHWNTTPYANQLQPSTITHPNLL